MLLNRINFFNTWYAIRLYAVASIPVFLVDSEIIFCIIGLTLFHMKSGLESVTRDYVHNFSTQLLFLIALRLLSLKIIFCTTELFL